MIIDAHSHLADRRFFERYGGKLPASMLDVQILLDAQEQAGIDMSVISGPRVMETGIERGKLAPVDVAKEYNDFVADLVSRHPKRLVALGIAHPMAGDAMFREMERAVKQLGLRGFLVIPRYDGDFLDSERALPFFEMCEKLDAVVFVHNADGCLGSEYMDNYRLVELVGRPNEMTLLAARLVMAGHMERFPNLKLLLGRLGGAIALYAGRIQEGWNTRISRTDGIPPWGQENLKSSFMDSLRRIYFDTQTCHPPAIRCGVDTVGADRIVLGSDFPPVPYDLAATIKDVTSSGISAADTQKVLGLNAMKLFRISASAR